MNYKRTYVNNIFEDIIPGSKIYMMPNLPMIEVERNGIKYKTTDIRFLNETAVNIFLHIMQTAMNTEDCEEVSFDVTGIEKNKLDLILDIVGGIRYEVSTGRKNGLRHSDCYFLTGISSTYMKRDNTEIVTIQLRKDHAQYLYEYAGDKKTVDYIDAIIYVANRSQEKISDYVKNSRLVDDLKEFDNGN